MCALVTGVQTCALPIYAAALENAKARFLGKQGALTALMKGLAQLAPDQKKAEGARINQLKQHIEGLLNARRQEMAQAELDKRLAAETIDVTRSEESRVGKAGVSKCRSRWSQYQE